MTKAKIILVGLLAAVVGLITWYWIDRTSILRSACGVGLPNYSIPSELDPNDIGCVILAPVASYKGLLITGFHTSNFSSPEFPPVPGQYGPSDTRSWFNCAQAGCGAAIDEVSERNYFRDCAVSAPFGTGFATVEAEGWVTVSEGMFGHMGSYPRYFYASRIVQVSPPSDEVIAEWTGLYRRMGICD